MKAEIFPSRLQLLSYFEALCLYVTNYILKHICSCVMVVGGGGGVHL
jgi:hypothetical protein